MLQHFNVTAMLHYVTNITRNIRVMLRTTWVNTYLKNVQEDPRRESSDFYKTIALPALYLHAGFLNGF